MDTLLLFVMKLCVQVHCNDYVIVSNIRWGSPVSEAVKWRAC